MKKRDIDFLFEIGTLRKVPRAWQQVLNGKVENIAEHIFRTALIAWTIAKREKADVAKVLRIALVHDLAETRATDIAFLHRDYVTRHEELAQKDIFEDTSLGDEALSLLKEYEERESLEARIVKDADNLDVDLELRELAQNGDTSAAGMRKQHRPHVREVKLYTKTAKKMWDQIQKTGPNNWHQALTNKWIKNKRGAR
ncbi:MAG TPA: HD domain-containing protein [Candidatus Paceibacterota bacterium]